MNIDIDHLRTVRRDDPGAIERAAADRSRRALGERMMLIAADHTARGSMAARR